MEDSVKNLEKVLGMDSFPETISDGEGNTAQLRVLQADIVSRPDDEDRLEFTGRYTFGSRTEGLEQYFKKLQAVMTGRLQKNTLKEISHTRQKTILDDTRSLITGEIVSAYVTGVNAVYKDGTERKGRIMLSLNTKRPEIVTDPINREELLPKIVLYINLPLSLSREVLYSFK